MRHYSRSDVMVYALVVVEQFGMSAAAHISALLPLLLFFSIAHAQQEGGACERLMSARTLQCELTQGVQASWEPEDITVKQTRSGEDGKVTYDSIDHAQRTVRLITATGAGDVTVMYSQGGVTFVERTPAGAGTSQLCSPVTRCLDRTASSSLNLDI